MPRCSHMYYAYAGSVSSGPEKPDQMQRKTVLHPLLPFGTPDYFSSPNTTEHTNGPQQTTAAEIICFFPTHSDSLVAVNWVLLH